LRTAFALTAALAAVFFPGIATAAPAPRVEVVVTLDAPPLATAIQRSRVLNARYKAQRLDLRAPTSVAYLHSLAVAQRVLAARITATVPDARVTWRYEVVLNGLAVRATTSRGSPRFQASPRSGRASPTAPSWTRAHT
jgi:cell division septation protein DedD